MAASRVLGLCKQRGEPGCAGTVSGDATMSDSPKPAEPLELPDTLAPDGASTSGQALETGQVLVDQGEWVDCWICEDVFRRRTQTKRYCVTCQRGFCEGWHGSLGRGYGTCVVCWEKPDTQLVL